MFIHQHLVIIVEPWYNENASLKKFHASFIPDNYTLIVSTNAVKLNEYGRGRFSGGVWIIYKTSICNEIAVFDGTSPYFVTIKWITYDLIINGLYNPAICDSSPIGNEKSYEIYLKYHFYYNR